MTNDNEDALRCADWCDEHSSGAYRTSAEAAAHLRRLVAENEALRKDLKTEHALSFRDQVASLQAEKEAKDGLLRQAVQELEWSGYRGALVAAIRQHLEGRA